MSGFKDYYDQDDFIDNANKFITFMLECRQWSGLDMDDIDQWISNFRNYNAEGIYYAYKLLCQTIYFSEDDLEFLLKEGIINTVINSDILNEQLLHEFQLSQQELQYRINNELKTTLFVPLLDGDKPHESGNQLSRILVQRMGINSSQSLFTYKLSDAHASFKRLIIVDDCIGSGDQCFEFWEKKARTADGTLLKDWCERNNIKAYYVALIGYTNSIEKLKNDLKGLNFCCVIKLSETHKVFSDTSYVWKDSTEMSLAKEYFSEILNEKCIPLYGYKDLDFAAVMHRNIPDWSLPLFWKGNSEWKILMKRKNSYE